jgi:hypothetical protein
LLFFFYDKKRKPIRAGCSFPHKLRADRICYTAWQQLTGLSKAGVKVLAIAGALQRAAPPGVTAKTTLARGKIRLPYKVLPACELSPCTTGWWPGSWKGYKIIDIIHTWPLGARRALQEAARLCSRAGAWSACA